MPVARATFVIYQDEPAPAAQPKSATPPPRKSSTSRIEAVTAKDKENLHPLTGRRTSTDDSQGKKRKTAVLATKLLVTTNKTPKEPHSPKKRKLSVSNTSKGPVEKKEKKEKEQNDDKKAAVNRRPLKKNRARKATGLAKVDEEVEEEKESEPAKEKGHRNISQAEVDSRCYELTVMPLADLSKAYEQSPPPEGLSEQETTSTTEHHTASAKDSERASSPAPSGKEGGSVISAVSQRSESVFSTPERKRIYSAFTFESPSPASKRFAVAVSRSTDSIDPFYDLKFDSVLDRVLRSSAGP